MGVPRRQWCKIKSMVHKTTESEVKWLRCYIFSRHNFVVSPNYTSAKELFLIANSYWMLDLYTTTYPVLCCTGIWRQPASLTPVPALQIPADPWATGSSWVSLLGHSAVRIPQQVFLLGSIFCLTLREWTKQVTVN